MKIFLCGDVMTGRGVDQILPDPCPPGLYEDYIRSATGYVRLAERANGPMPRHADLEYIWGAALDEWDRAQPQARIVNLETSITRNEAFERKGVNFRMSPENAGCLQAAHIDCCVLANNHVLDWGQEGLLDTLDALDRMRVKTAGAGRNLAEATAPAILDIPGEGRLLILAFASPSSGAPEHWAAYPHCAGINLLPVVSEAVVAGIASQIGNIRRPRDVVVASIHWGANWGYEIETRHRWFAHALIDQAGVSVVHGHSSHHAKAVEVYANRLVLYGCGDFLNDYEGIGGLEDFRGDLALMYFADVDPSNGDLRALNMTPLQIRRFQLGRPSSEDIEWLQRTLDRESAPFGARIALAPDGRLKAAWKKTHAPSRDDR